MIRPILLAASLVSTMPARCADAAAPLAPGAPAPALKPEKWYNGAAVAGFDPKKVYIIECWATWCGPCVQQIPHMNALHHKFKDRGLVVIGANVGDRDEETVARFVARKGGNMAYLVTFDGAAKQVSKDWLNAARVEGIPHSFVVRDGRILWHGHPMELTETNVEAVLRGGGMTATPPGAKPKLSEALIRYRNARLEILALFRGNDPDQAMAKIAEHEKVLAATEPSDPDLLRGIALSIKGAKDASLDHYRKAAKAANGNPGALFRVANGLLDYGTVRDHPLALECAREAARLDGDVLLRHMLARAEAAVGNKDAAISIMEGIVKEDDAEIYQKELRKLREGGPPAP